jgi:hypothetical protein
MTFIQYARNAQPSLLMAAPAPLQLNQIQGPQPTQPQQPAVPQQPLAQQQHVANQQPAQINTKIEITDDMPIMTKR